MDKYEQAIAHIIQAQESIIGPVAKDQAGKVVGLKIDSSGIVHIEKGSGQEALSAVVHQFSEFFGHASVLVCREAVHNIVPPIPSEELPEDLK